MLCFAVFGALVLIGLVEAQDQATISRLLETVLKIQPPIHIGFDKSRVRTPDHMMDFYHQFSNAHSPEHLNDNIIRNIFPLQDNWTGERSAVLSNLMIFNLSCVQPGEAVYSAQLNLDPHDFILHPHHKGSHPHKHTLRKKLPLPPPLLQLRVFRVSGLTPVELGLKQLGRDVTTSKQLSIDVTALLLDAIASSVETRETLLAVRLEGPNNQPLVPKMAVHSPANTTHRAASFLIVFSEENNFRPFPLPSLHTDLLASMLNTSDADNEVPRTTRKSWREENGRPLHRDMAFSDAENEIPQTTEKLLRAASFRPRFSDAENEVPQTTEKVLSQNSFRPRSDAENEVPQTTEKVLRQNSFRPRSSDAENEIPQTTRQSFSMAVSDARSEVRQTGRKTFSMAASDTDDEVPQTTEKAARESSSRPALASTNSTNVRAVLQSAGKSLRRVQLGQGASEDNDARVRRSLKDNELTDDESDEERNSYYVFPHKTKTTSKRKLYKAKSKSKPHLNEHVIGRRWQDCRRKRLTVNFADIGWGEWVLSPQAFEAYYCDGACSYPLIRSMRPTNHATLQSMVRAVGGQDVPEPRCVADSLSPVTLLYIDQVGNIVLKNYPAMSVRSCACR